MTCYRPLKGFPIGRTKNGKVDYKITGYDAQCVVKNFKGDRIDVLPFIPNVCSDGFVITDFVPIPCGRCIGCRMSRSRDWAIRCSLESRSHDVSYFLTLTYNPLLLPYSNFVDVSTGEICYKSTLVKKDLQKFIKRLRDHYDREKGKKFRYYACGEYGSKSVRPHYHMIAFGLEIDDLVPYKETALGDMLYTSEWLSNIWQKGYVIVGSVTFESCAYVARYVNKKKYGSEADFYDLYNIEPEFNIMSLKPAIGREWFDNNYDKIYKNDEIILPDGHVVTPPRYFDKCMDDIDEELMSDIKENRVDVAQHRQHFKEQLTDQRFSDMLKSEEKNKENSLKKLVRTLD